MNAQQFAKRRARIEQEAWRRGGGYAGRALAALVRESGARVVKSHGKVMGWALPCGQSVCVKTRYSSALDAAVALVELVADSRRGKVPVRYYACPYCLGWHLTSQPSH